MAIDNIILYFSYVVLTFLSLWVVIKYDSNGLFKAIFIPFALILAMSTYFTIESLKGMPIRVSSIETKVQLNWFIVSKQTNQIFLWISRPNSLIPIAYVIPYDKDIAKMLEKIGERIRKGYKVMIQGNDASNQTKLGMKEEGIFLKYKFKGKFPPVKPNSSNTPEN